MKTSSAKAKGRNLQKYVVSKILQYFKRLTPNDVRSTSMGAPGVDVQLSEAALNVFPYAVECKNVERIKVLYDMWDQAVLNAKEKEPLLVVKSNNKPVLAIVDLSEFLLLRALIDSYARKPE